MKNNFLPISFLSLLLLAFTACRKENTTWKNDWVAPIINDTLSLGNFYNDSTLIAGTNGTIDLDFSRTILDVGIADIVKIPDTSIVQIFNPTVAGLTIPPGFDVFNAVEEHSLSLPVIQLKKIRVYSGKITLKVYNPLNTMALYKVILPGVVKNGVVFEQSYSVPAGTQANPGTSTAILDVSGYEMDLRGINGTHFNVLRSQLNVKTDPLGPSINLNLSDEFKVEAKIENLKLDYALGYFGNQIISDTSTLTVPYLDNITAGLLDLPSVNLQVEIENGMKVPIKGIISLIENTNANNQTVSLAASSLGQPILISPAIGSWNTLQPSTNEIAFNATNSNVEQVLENLGSTYNLGYSIQLNPLGNVNGSWDEIFSTSRIKVKLKAQMPLQLMADGLTLQDTFDVNLKQTSPNISVVSGKLILEAMNAFPMQCEVKLSFLTDQGFTIEEVFGTSLIQSANYGAIDPVDGLRKKLSILEFVFPESLINSLDQIKKLKVEVQLNTPNPINGVNQTVAIPYGAFVGVKIKTAFQTKVSY